VAAILRFLTITGRMLYARELEYCGTDVHYAGKGVDELAALPFLGKFGEMNDCCRDIKLDTRRG
jgi:hypothetical protein